MIRAPLISLRSFVTFAIAILFCAAIGRAMSERAPQAARVSPIEVTYLANEGFLIRGGGHSILIDALFAAGVAGYPTIPDRERALIVQDAPPYNRVDLVLITHVHSDHFAPEVAGQFLSQNLSAMAVAPQQTANEFERDFPGFNAIQTRVRAVTPQDETGDDVEIPGIGLKAFHLKHGDTENNAYLVTLGGRTILHFGDAEGDPGAMAAMKLGAPVDIAFIPYWFADEPDALAAVKQYLRPKQVIFMHFPVKKPNNPNLKAELDEVGGLEKLQKKCLAAWPGAFIFTKPLEQKEF